jgi:hypothetical protein
LEKRRRRRKVVLLRKRLGLSEHSFWNKVSMCCRRDRQQYDGSATRKNAKRERKIEPRQCAGPLDLQNKIRDSYATSRCRCPSPGPFLPELDRRRKPRGPFSWKTDCQKKSESRFRRLSNIEQRADSRNGILSRYRSALRTCAVIESVALTPVRRKHDAPTSTAVVHRSARGDRTSCLSEVPGSDDARPHRAGIFGHRPAYL